MYIYIYTHTMHRNQSVRRYSFFLHTIVEIFIFQIFVFLKTTRIIYSIFLYSTRFVLFLPCRRTTILLSLTHHAQTKVISVNHIRVNCMNR